MKTIYFVCYGNLCRSPFAEKYAAMRASELGLEAVRFDGAGIGATQGQPCPRPAITAAQEVDVDLTSHLAKHTEKIQPGPGDWVIAMDRFVFGSLARSLAIPLSEVKGPGDSRLELMMQSLAGDPGPSGVGLDVPDPMGQSVAAYRECYDLLMRAVDRLLERITH
jgi:protein-tyrosine phosphatase